MGKLAFLPLWMALLVLRFFFLASSAGRILQNNQSSTAVRLHIQNHHRVVMENGLVEVILSKPSGHITGIKCNGIDNVLETLNGHSNRGYWDVVWNKPGHRITFDKLRGTNFNVIMEDESQVEVSFSKVWNVTTANSTVPLNVDKRYILRGGCSGLYMYAIIERLEGWPDIDIDQIRIVFKLKNDRFHLMVLPDDKRRIMPTPRDRRSGRRLAYPEAVVLTNPSNPQLAGEVDDKYQYSFENQHNRVHGWMSESDEVVGFWVITPSDEFRAGGPIKPDLTSHVGPSALSMFTSTHYTGKDLNTRFRNGEPWKKVFGPLYVYLNSISGKEGNTSTLWEDAKEQMLIEVKSWPYVFPQSEDFPRSDQRGTVTGQLLVRDKYINKKLIRRSPAYVGLAAPGELGSWQTESKGYQFWTRTKKDNHFLIENVRPGDYNLYAWVPGVIGDYKYAFNVTIEPGSQIKLGALVYEPPRNGPTLWEIGIPNRRATEFFVPDGYPTLANKLYMDHPANKFRQYGLWDRYTDLYPTHDLTYTIGISNYHRDWFFAHVLRKVGKTAYEATTWRVIFLLKNACQTGNYTLQIALASANAAELQVRINNKTTTQSYFSTGLIGKDNAIARHGIHGLYRLYSIQFPSYLLRRGNNAIYLTQARTGGPFRGIMYDYIRLERPPPEMYSVTR